MVPTELALSDASGTETESLTTTSASWLSFAWIVIWAVPV
jgi:hypothetical protein